MKNNLVHVLEAAAASLKIAQEDGVHQYGELINEIDQTLHLLKSRSLEHPASGSGKHRFVAADRCDHIRYLTVQGGTIRLWNSHGQAEALSNIAHDSTQELIFALEDAASEAEMLDALNSYSYLTWKVYLPVRS